MTKYKIAYVDESPVDARRFKRYARNYFDIVSFLPVKEKEQTAELIFENHIDAVIADFDLAEQDPQIHYTGADLVSYLLECVEGLPVFILTSYEDDAVTQGDDVNIVYKKSEMNKGDGFLIKVKNQIEKYHHKLDEWQTRLLALVEEGRKRKLDAFEEEEMFKLDGLLERALDKKTQIPDAVRKSTQTDELAELIKKVDALTKRIDNKDV